MKINFPMKIEAADNNARTITGRVVTWDEQGNTSAGPTVFSKNSIELKKNIKLLLEHDTTRPIGKLMEATIDESGITAKFKIANTMAGEDALVEAADGLRDGFSVGVNVNDWSNDNGVMAIKSSRLVEVSLVTEPAIDSARVSEVAASENSDPETPESDQPTEGEQVSDTTVPAPAEETVEAAKVEAAAPKPAFFTSPRSPIVNAASYVEYSIKAAMGDDEARTYVRAANDTSTNTGLTLAPHLAEFNTNTIDGRPAVDAIDRGVLPASGMSFTLPKLSTAPTVTIEAENGALGGTEMASTYVTVDVKKAAGIQTISWELLDRSSPVFYDQLIRELNSAYAKYTDGAVVSALVSGGTAAGQQAATIAGLKAFITASVPAAYAACGKFARNLVVNPSWWETIMAAEDTTNRPLFTAAQPSNAPGNVSGQSLTGQVMGLNLYVDPHMSVTTKIDDSAFVIAPEAIRYYESPTTTLQVQALANGQVQVAIYGYYAIAPIYGAGVRRFNLTD